MRWDPRREGIAFDIYGLHWSLSRCEAEGTNAPKSIGHALVRGCCGEKWVIVEAA